MSSTIQFIYQNFYSEKRMNNSFFGIHSFSILLETTIQLFKYYYFEVNTFFQIRIFIFLSIEVHVFRYLFR